MDEAIEKYRSMLQWRTDNNVNAYIEEVDKCGDDPMKVPLSEVFNPYVPPPPLKLSSIMKSNYNHGVDKEGRVFDIRMMGQTDINGFLSQNIDDVVKYNIYLLVSLPSPSQPSLGMENSLLQQTLQGERQVGPYDRHPGHRWREPQLRVSVSLPRPSP